jgi:hypothetical protein
MPRGGSGPKSRTVPIKKMTKEKMRQDSLVYATDMALANSIRPRIREECEREMRPCPFVGCKYHLYLDINPETGSIKLNFPDLEVWEMGKSCTLDVTDDGPVTLEEVGGIMNLTRERIRQLEESGLQALGYDPFLQKVHHEYTYGEVHKRKKGRNSEDEERESSGEDSGIHFPSDIRDEW